MNVLDYVTRAGEGERTQFAGLGFIYHLGGDKTDGRLSVVEHPIAPYSMGAPTHTHRDEDEFSLVLRGEVTFEMAGQIVIGRPGDFIVKARGIPHAFWNATGEEVSFLEIISPAGFENYFREISKYFDPETGPDFEKVNGAVRRYNLELDFADAERIMGLIERERARQTA
jgi:quercetin dioxygenase-like cupin family protein